MRTLLISALSAMALLASTATHASVVVVNQVFDLSFVDVDLGHELRFSSDVFAAPLAIHQGDTVQLNFSFAGNQAIQLSNVGAGNLQSIQLGLFQASAAGTSTYTNNTLSLQLTGPTAGRLAGAVARATQSSSSSSSSIDAFFDDSYLDDGETATFTALQASFVAGALGNGSVDYFYDSAYFNVAASRAIVTTADAGPNDPTVPEPATWALVALGLAAAAVPRGRGRVRAGQPALAAA